MSLLANDGGGGRYPSTTTVAVSGSDLSRQAFANPRAALHTASRTVLSAPRFQQATSIDARGPAAFAGASQTTHFSSAAFALATALAIYRACCAGGRRRPGRHRQRRICTVAQQAYASERQSYEGAPIAPPPDLPSLLLKNRIVYLGAPITNEVAELIIAQLLYLNYESADKPVTMYINSTGCTLKNSTRYVGEQKVGRETDAFAIADCMMYVRPKIVTMCIGQANGTAAMLLGLGSKGKRFALPNSTIMLSEPREPPARGPRQATDLHILAKEVLTNRDTVAELLAKGTGRSKADVIQDTQRCYYMTPDEAVSYNLIDKVLTPEVAKEVGQELPAFASAL